MNNQNGRSSANRNAFDMSGPYATAPNMYTAQGAYAGQASFNNPTTPQNFAAMQGGAGYANAGPQYFPATQGGAGQANYGQPSSSGYHHQPQYQNTPDVETRLLRKQKAIGDITISTKGIERTQMYLDKGIAPSGRFFYKRHYPWEPATGAFDSCDQFAMPEEERAGFMSRSMFHIDVDHDTVATSGVDGKLSSVIASLPPAFMAMIQNLKITIELPETSQAFEAANTPFNKHSPIWLFLTGLMAEAEVMSAVKNITIILRGSLPFEEYGVPIHSACTIPLFCIQNKMRFWLSYQQGDEKSKPLVQEAYSFMRKQYQEISQRR